MSSTPPPPPPPSSQPPPPDAGAASAPGSSRKPWWKRWWVIGIAGIVVLGALASIGDDPADEPASERGETTADTAASDPTAAPDEATTSAQPTPTPTQTTPEAEPEPVAVPDTAGMSREEAIDAVESAGLQARVEEQEVSQLEDQDVVLGQRPEAGEEVEPGDTVTLTVGGEFVWDDTITLEGSGDDVVDVQVPDDQIAIARISHGGSGNFAIWSYDADGDQLDLLVNDIGAYEGTRLLNLETAARELEVTAGGAWSIELAPLHQARRIASDGTIDGTGDDVVIADDSAPDASRVALSHSGDGNFAIWAYAERTTDLLVNDVGPYEGKVRWPGGTVVLDITAGGAWSLALE